MRLFQQGTRCIRNMVTSWLVLTLSGCGVLNTVNRKPSLPQAAPVTGRPLTAPGTKPKGRLALVPCGNVSPDALQSLVRYYEQHLNIKPEVTMQLSESIMSGFWDETRQQYKGDSLVNWAKAVHNGTATVLINGKSFSGKRYHSMVFIIDKDIYADEDPTNRFAFTITQLITPQPTKGGVALVSLARFDPAFFGEPHNRPLARQRLRKYVTQKIGYLYYGLPRNNDPQSVLYQGTISLPDLDKVGEGF